MTIPRHTILFLTLATTGLLLQGCGPRGPGGSGVRLYEVDMKGGARTCDTSNVAPAAGQAVDATMKVGSDGGWCGLYVRNGSRPFDAGLLTVRAQHGTPFVHTVGTETRIDYTPDKGFAGADSFTVQLLPGDATVRVAVTAVPH